MLNDDYTHSTEIIINGLFTKSEEQEQVRLKITGDGSLDYFINTFRATLLAFGFDADIAQKLDLVLEESDLKEFMRR